MRIVNADDIKAKVAQMCIDANRYLPQDVLKRLDECAAKETSPTAIEIFRQLRDNAALAADRGLPLCQDCGLAVFFVEIGEDVRIEGGGLKEAITEGMVRGYKDGYLRKSLCDPFTRKNTGTNAPAIIHIDLIPGDRLKIWVMAKGGGSENMSRVVLLAPAEGWAGIKKFVVNRVAEAGSNPCPPVIVGVGIGGNFETAPIMAKKALLRPLGEPHPDPAIAKLEAELLEAINQLGIGPMGLGGETTCLDVKIDVAPCHLASLPLAVNIQCHSARHKEVEL
jgi:fumarate hydratase subunit alpha